LCGLAAGAGVGGAAAALALQALLALATNLFFHGRLALEGGSLAENHLGLLVVFIPALGGLLIGLLARYGSAAAEEANDPPSTTRGLITSGKLASRHLALRPLASVLALGCGAPLGAEGPLIQSGGALVGLVGRWRSLTRNEGKTLLAAAVAAAMAATFSAPVAAVLLVVELLLLEFRPRSLLPVALASAVATGLRWAFLGSGPLFAVTEVHTLDGWDLPAFVLLGLCAGLLAIFLTRGVHLLEEAFERLALHWMWWPVLGGAVVGLVGLLFPQALGVGNEYLEGMVAGRATLGFLLAMLIGKTLAWMMAVGSGVPGGLVGPLLLIGASLGGTLACVAGAFLPEGPECGLWAVVCMAAVFAGVTRAPLTAAVFALELTYDSGALLPLLIACTVSDLVALALQQRSPLTATISHSEELFNPEGEPEALAAQTVGQVMTSDVTVVPASLPLPRLYALFDAAADNDLSPNRGGHQGYPVVDDAARLIGVITRSDLPEKGLRDHLDWLVAADLLSAAAPLVARPDEPLRDAADRMLSAGVGRLPVVAPEAPDRVVGWLSRGDILKALKRPETLPFEKPPEPTTRRRAA
jgi:H+/Cl- antiporter ClcA